MISSFTSLISADNISNSAAFSHNQEKTATNSYTLSDILNPLSLTYKNAILKAISTVAPQEDMYNIRFEPLVGFSLSKVFSFEVHDKKFVLRLLVEKHPLERRIAEVNAHRIGYKLGIAPKLFFVDDIPLVMVIEFIEGRTFSRHDLDDDETIYKVMQAIKKFHQYSGETQLQKQTKAQLIQKKYKDSLIKGIVFPSCFDELYNKLQYDFAELESEYVPSHGDTNPQNIIIGNDEKIYLIDWDISNYERPFLNIGWLSCITAANNEQIKNLLRAYLEREPSESEFQETLFLRDSTTFLMATIWIGRQEERDQETLDTILHSPIKTYSERFKEGFSVQDILNLSGMDLTIHVLGCLKEFIVNQKSYPLLCQQHNRSSAAPNTKY